MWAHQNWRVARQWHILVSLVNTGEEMPRGQVIHPGWSGLPERGLHSHAPNMRPTSQSLELTEGQRILECDSHEYSSQYKMGSDSEKILGVQALPWVPRDCFCR